MTSLIWVVWDQASIRDAEHPVSELPDGERVSVRVSHRDAAQAWARVCRVWGRDGRVSAQVSVLAVRVSGQDAGRVCPDEGQGEDQVCRVSERGDRDEERACGEEAAQPQPHEAATTPSCRRSAYSPENKERYVYPYVTSSCADWTGSFLG